MLPRMRYLPNRQTDLRTQNLVFVDPCSFHTGVLRGFLFLLGFPLYKIKTKSKWRLQSKIVPPRGRISKTRKSTPIFFSFKSESHWLVDRVGCETPIKSNFLKNGKIVISVKKIQNFSRSRITKRISPLESSREI